MQQECVSFLRRRLWMQSCGLGTVPQQLLDELRQIRSLDVILTARQNTEIRLRVVGIPEERTRIRLHRLGLRLPNRPKIIDNVVRSCPLEARSSTFINKTTYKTIELGLAKIT